MIDDLRRHRQDFDITRLSDQLGESWRRMDHFTVALLSLAAVATNVFACLENERHRAQPGMALRNLRESTPDAERLRKLIEGTTKVPYVDMVAPATRLGRPDVTTTATTAVVDAVFRLPRTREISRLARSALNAADLARMVFGTNEALRAAMGEVVSPWLRAEATTRSAVAFAEVVSMGRCIDLRLPYEADLGRALRLGSQDDQLLLYVETKRVLKAIGACV